MLKHIYFFAFGVTIPLSVKISLPASVFVVKVTVFCCLFGLPFVLNLTLTSPVSPGLIGAFGQTGTVQPQVACAFVITKSVLPEFVTLKTVSTISPSFTVPKSYTCLSKVIEAVPFLISISLDFALSKFSFLIFVAALPSSQDEKRLQLLQMQIKLLFFS